MVMIDFFIKVKQQEKQKLPFVIYSKPNKKLLEGFFQKDEHLYLAEDFHEKGFVFAPFDGNQIILIPKKSHTSGLQDYQTSSKIHIKRSKLPKIYNLKIILKI
jgi:isochorismate synthase